MTYNKKHILPPIEFLHECFSYDKKTGVLRWKKRPLSHFKCSRAMKQFNTAWSGKEAGSIRKYTYNAYRGIGISIKGTVKTYFAHRIIWMMEHGSVNGDIDHIDHDGLNNKLSNLRLVTNQENHMNATKRKDNTSGFVGVIKMGRKWMGRAGINGKRKSVGSFDTPEEAYAAVQKKQKELGFHENHGN